jgi:hypothetical protein
VTIALIFISIFIVSLRHIARQPWKHSINLSTTALHPAPASDSSNDNEAASLDQSLVSDADVLLGSFQGLVTSLVSTMNAKLVMSSLSPTIRLQQRQQQQQAGGLDLSVDSVSIFSADQSAILPNADTTMASIGHINNSNLTASSSASTYGQLLRQSQLSQLSEDAAIAAILERYSDRFAALISDKVAKKLESSMGASGLLGSSL